jgi:hypothetical protein
VETVARLSPPQPVQSLREGTRAQAVRLARRCYDHLAGRLAVALGRNLLSAFTDASWLYLSPQTRAVVISDTGRAALATSLGIAWPPPHGATRQTAA